MRKLILLAAASLMFPACASNPALSGSAQTPAGHSAMPMALPTITIYHLEGRRSERIVWLMEELGFPYELEYVR
jgi:glutathione S-transferase